MIADLLGRTRGYVVFDAASGAEALEIFAQQRGRIDLLLTDLIMPGMTGRQLADTLSAQSPDMEVIFMSGYVDASRSEAMEKGLHYLPKPMDLYALEAMISDLLKKKKRPESR
jgi:two-component system cell cycle sensor histidine kinase/response regulator CckA